MYKKLLLYLIAVTASNNALHAAENKFGKPTVNLKGIFTIAAGSATISSLGCLLIDKTYIPFIAPLSFVLNCAVTKAIEWKSVTIQDVNRELASKGAFSCYAEKKDRDIAARDVFTFRVLKGALATGIFTGVVASALSYAGYTVEDLKNLISR